MRCTKKLDSADDILVQTYYKKGKEWSGPLCCVIVNSINVGAGTVNAKIGAGSERDYPKQELFKYINFLCYSDTEA